MISHLVYKMSANKCPSQLPIAQSDVLQLFCATMKKVMYLIYNDMK